ncbi:hypothetical protein DFP72DRAFT_53454 [Ephemerocybe angulata]|uniref:Uncharacterized protein n=1 Tax=Ephemerocybe angulata TaxID=980116 RepID=A0A8H6HDW7_9AGAR|nr:hypothetical protein DFP72DRAFT_53454 [Tulosesus angulatus]
MPVPVRRIRLDDDVLPPSKNLARKNLAARRPHLRENNNRSMNFQPLRPSPLTSQRPVSAAFDDEEDFQSHVPVPLDDMHGLAAPMPEKRRTARFVCGGPVDNRPPSLVRSPYLSGDVGGKARSHDSLVHGSPRSSHSGEMQRPGRRSGEKEGRVFSAQSSDEDFLPEITPVRLAKPSSFSDLRKRASQMFGEDSSNGVHSTKSRDGSRVAQMTAEVQDEKRGRRKSIAKFVIEIFRPKSKRSTSMSSLSIEVTRTTRVTKIEDAASLRRFP